VGSAAGWGHPPDPADPDYQVAVEIREAIMEVELLRLGKRPHL